MEYISENHSKYLLMCHLIFVCKYRKKLLLKVGDDIKTEIESIANHYGWQIIEQEIDQDHIHILIRYSPKWSILEIVRLLKQLTTYRMWQKHNKYLSQHFWKERTFWSDGYFSCSIGNVSKEIIQKYIQEQGR
ncbi:putative transposase [Anoxybacillus vitaminiphilus]|uniref:Putative transposase n=1 Tax=Paranoxybacillus vitaminiphilus TaxID=581036 RepID=A0A327Y0A9_9BACL|nr:IS200/IS605 family transposase [Anoxybacillus vitaminiphilus]RAK13847.1 putative transposase [Anoxybacillus vitaminiphilus]